MKTVYFYVLKCPTSGDIRYVGRSVSPEVRYRKHIYTGKADGEKDRKASWIRSLLDKGLKPKLEIVDKIENYESTDEVKQREQTLILEYRKKYDLKNDRDIVENGYQFTEKCRKKMSKAQTGKRKVNKDGVEKTINPIELDKFLNSGWKLGRTPLSKEALKNRGKASSNTKHINNGVRQKKVKIDEVNNFLKRGWVLGRLPMSNEQKEKLKEAWKLRKEKLGNTGQPKGFIPHNKGKKLNKNNTNKREYV